MNKKHRKQIELLSDRECVNVIYTVSFKKYLQYINLFLKLILIGIKYDIKKIIAGHLKNNLISFV